MGGQGLVVVTNNQRGITYVSNCIRTSAPTTKQGSIHEVRVIAAGCGRKPEKPRLSQFAIRRSRALFVFHLLYTQEKYNYSSS